MACIDKGDIIGCPDIFGMCETFLTASISDDQIAIDDFYILREKSLAIYFEDSHFRRIRTFNFILSNIYVDKRSRIR